MKTLVVIPAFNEEQSLGKVVRDLKSHGFTEMIVVDDGSTDRTYSAAMKLDVPVFKHILNRGLGAALGTGFEYARRNDFDSLVTFDADGQHLAQDIKKLLAPIKAGKFDVVVGSRLLKNIQSMPKDRLILNYLSNIATFVIYGVWATDTLSGLRAFNRKALNTIQIKTDRMEVSNEFYKEIKRIGLRYGEISIKPIYTEYSRLDEQSNSNALDNGFKMILRLFR